MTQRDLFSITCEEVAISAPEGERQSDIVHLMHIWCMHTGMLVTHDRAGELHSLLCSMLAWVQVLARNPQTFCFPNKTAVNGYSIHAHATFSVVLDQPEQYSVMQHIGSSADLSETHRHSASQTKLQSMDNQYMHMLSSLLVSIILSNTVLDSMLAWVQVLARNSHTFCFLNRTVSQYMHMLPSVLVSINLSNTVLGSILAWVQVLARNSHTFCFPNKTAVNGNSIHTHAIFSVGLYHPEQYNVTQRWSKHVAHSSRISPDILYS